MKNTELIKKIAQQQSIKENAAADRMAGAVNRVIRTLRRGKQARLPGLGIIKPGEKWDFRQERDDH
jgi:nucleoid DNA-binding protein